MNHNGGKLQILNPSPPRVNGLRLKNFKFLSLPPLKRFACESHLPTSNLGKFNWENNLNRNSLIPFRHRVQKCESHFFRSDKNRTIRPQTTIFKITIGPHSLKNITDGSSSAFMPVCSRIKITIPVQSIRFTPSTKNTPLFRSLYPVANRPIRHKTHLIRRNCNKKTNIAAR